MNARVSIWFAKLGANEEEIDEKKTTKRKEKNNETYIHKNMLTCARRLRYYCVQRDFASSAP